MWLFPLQSLYSTTSRCQLPISATSAHHQLSPTYRYRYSLLQGARNETRPRHHLMLQKHTITDAYARCYKHVDTAHLSRRLGRVLDLVREVLETPSLEVLSELVVCLLFELALDRLHQQTPVLDLLHRRRDTSLMHLVHVPEVPGHIAQVSKSAIQKQRNFDACC